MIKFKFLYADYNASNREIASFKVGELVHDDGGIVASSYRGGLLANCNLRILFIAHVGENFVLVNEDFRRQGLFIFELSYYFLVLDVYRVGEYTQVLLTPGDPDEDEIRAVVEAARGDFNELLHTQPVGVLDTEEWRRRLGRPVGQNGKTLLHKGS